MSAELEDLTKAPLAADALIEPLRRRAETNVVGLDQQGTAQHPETGLPSARSAVLARSARTERLHGAAMKLRSWTSRARFNARMSSQP